MLKQEASPAIALGAIIIMTVCAIGVTLINMGVL